MESLQSSETPRHEQMPTFKAALDIRIPYEPILDLFKKASKKLSFYVSEVTSNSVTAVMAPKKSFASFLCLTPLDVGAQKATVVKLQIATYQRNTLRLVVVKGLQGGVRSMNGLIECFRANLESWLAKEMQNQVSGVVSSAVTIRRVQLISYSEFTKLVCDKDSAVGQVFSEFCGHWETIKHDPNCPLISETKGLLERILLKLLEYHNIKSVSTNKLYQHYKPLVEKYLFSRLMQDILRNYQLKYGDLIRDFREKQRQLNELDRAMVMEKIGVKAKFQLGAQSYVHSTECLNKITTQATPLDKLNCLLEAMTSMKTSVLEHSKGKLELLTMDDQLPVVIFIVSQVTDPFLVPQISLLKDYVSDSIGLDNELCIVINIDSAILYLANELVIE